MHYSAVHVTIHRILKAINNNLDAAFSSLQYYAMPLHSIPCTFLYCSIESELVVNGDDNGTISDLNHFRSMTRCSTQTQISHSDLISNTHTHTHTSTSRRAASKPYICLVFGSYASSIWQRRNFPP